VLRIISQTCREWARVLGQTHLLILYISLDECTDDILDEYIDDILDEYTDNILDEYTDDILDEYTDDILDEYFWNGIWCNRHFIIIDAI